MLLLNLHFPLDHLRRLSNWLLRLAGAGIDDDISFDYPNNSDLTDHHRQKQYHDDHGLEELEEHCQVVRFDELSASDFGGASAETTILTEGCVVCLGDFQGAARVRRPRGCRHVFHCGCLDRWAAHGHRNCPLCRAPFLPLFLLPLPLPAS